MKGIGLLKLLFSSRHFHSPTVTKKNAFVSCSILKENHSFLILFVCSCVELNSISGLKQASQLPQKAAWGLLLCVPYLPSGADNTACHPCCPWQGFRDLQRPHCSSSSRDPPYHLRDNYLFMLFPSWKRAGSTCLPHECLRSSTKEKQYSEKIHQLTCLLPGFLWLLVKEESFPLFFILILQGFLFSFYWMYLGDTG